MSGYTGGGVVTEPTGRPTAAAMLGGRVGIGVAVSAVCVVLAARQVDWRATLAALGAAQPVLLLAGGLCMVTMFLFFAVRWAILLDGIAPLPVPVAFAYLMIGYFANTALPMRLGDAVRVALLGRRRDVDASVLLGTVVVERLVDLFFLLSIAISMLWIVDLPPLLRGGLLSAAAAGLGLVVVVGGLALGERRLLDLSRRLPRLPAGVVPARTAAFVARVASGTRAVREPRQLARVFAATALAWCAAGIGTAFWIAAFGVAAPPYACLLVLAAVNLGGAVPSSPGGIGVYHTLAMLALSVWVADHNTTLAYAIGTHGAFTLVAIVCGLWALAREGLSPRDLASGRLAGQTVGAGR
ncbi:MAG TPA: lysylphosphatidylglycerol synthase transmembrane domain-containing protein [Chloroflexota bacterium]